MNLCLKCRHEFDALREPYLKFNLSAAYCPACWVDIIKHFQDEARNG